MNSWMNYPNKLKLCRENQATGKLIFANKGPSCCSCKHTLLSNTTCDIANFSNWLTFIYMLTELLSSTIPKLFCQKMFLKFYSWYSWRSKPVIKKTANQFCVIFIKKYSKRKCQFPKNAISLLFPCHVGKQVFTYTFVFFLFEYHELRFKGKHLCQSLFLNEVAGRRATTL